MQKIREWMEQNPDGAKELRRQNSSYVFFREVQLSDKDEAVGAQGVPLTPGRSIAVDKSLHVYGTPFFIEGELPIESERSKTPFRRLMIAQDTGSAIVGPARADLYFGAGADAGKVSGRLRHNMRFVMLVPKSLDPVARGRKMPVPDERPSEKIAKLFPQTDPLKDRQEQNGVRSHRRSPRRRRKTRLRRRRRPRPGRANLRHPGRCVAKPVPLPEARPDHQAGRQSRASVTSAAIATSDETPDVELDPRIAGAAAAQARLERGRARAVGKRRQAGQAAAQATSCREAAGRVAGGRKRALAPKPAASPKPPRRRASLLPPKAGAAAAGAARPPRALAAVARPEGDRCPARSARHDPDPRASRAVRLPAARPSATG